MKLVALLIATKIVAGGSAPGVVVENYRFLTFKQCHEDAAYRNSPEWEDMRKKFTKDGKLILHEEWSCLYFNDTDLDFFNRAMEETED